MTAHRHDGTNREPPSLPADFRSARKRTSR